MAAMLPQYDQWGILGQGGMGAVYRARQVSLDRRVAIKILPPEVAEDEAQFIERFQNEARTMAKMNHPAIVSVYDFGETAEGQLYFVMEFVDGTDVSQMIRSQGRLAPEHALAITAHVCDALRYAHERGVIHRDIKPANILIDREGHVKVADFGLAKMNDPAMNMGLTRSHMALGTPDFVAPEALVFGTTVDHRADLYAIGVMLHQMLTGEIPRGAFRPASEKAGTDSRYDEIVIRCMEPDPTQRFQSAVEIRRALDLILTVPRVKAADEVSHTSVPQVGKSRAKQKPQLKPPPQRMAPAAAGVHTSPPAKGSSRGMWIGTLVTIIALTSATYFLRKPVSTVAALPVPSTPAKPPPPSIAFTNSLGIKFVPVSTTAQGSKVHFSIWEVRNRDYEIYAAENPEVDGTWKTVPEFTKLQDHPVVMINWADAVAFCEWLTRYERDKKAIGDSDVYRLPTDLEWSVAVGLEREPGQTPEERSVKLATYPWGAEWPPPAGAGNFADETSAAADLGVEWKADNPIAGYNDGFATTAPVGTFAPNALGIFDLAGNVWEWCYDNYAPKNSTRVLRGGSWQDSNKRGNLMSSFRFDGNPPKRYGFRGIRLALEARGDLPSAVTLASVPLLKPAVTPSASVPKPLISTPTADPRPVVPLTANHPDKAEASSSPTLLPPLPITNWLASAPAKNRWLKVVDAKAPAQSDAWENGWCKITEPLDLVTRFRKTSKLPSERQEDYVDQGVRVLMKPTVSKDDAPTIVLRFGLTPAASSNFTIRLYPDELVVEHAAPSQTAGPLDRAELTRARIPAEVLRAKEWDVEATAVRNVLRVRINGLDLVKNDQNKLLSPGLAFLNMLPNSAENPVMHVREVYYMMVDASQPIPDVSTAGLQLDLVRERLSKLATGFKGRYASDALRPFEDSLKALNGSYVTNGIARARADAITKGSPEDVAALDAEKAAVEAGTPVPASDAPGTPRVLADLRATYRAAHAKHVTTREAATVKLYETLLAALDAYVAELSTSGNSAEASAVKAWRNEIAVKAWRDGKVGKNAAPEASPSSTTAEPPRTMSPSAAPPKHTDGWIDIISLLDVKRDTMNSARFPGEFTCTKKVGALKLESKVPFILNLPVAIQGREYIFEVDKAKIDDGRMGGFFSIEFPVKDKTFNVNFNSEGYARLGTTKILEGQPEWATKPSPPLRVHLKFGSNGAKDELMVGIGEAEAPVWSGHFYDRSSGKDNNLWIHAAKPCIYLVVGATVGEIGSIRLKMIEGTAEPLK